MLDQALSPAQKRGSSLKRLFELAFTRRREDLAALGGNLRIRIPTVAAWTIVTSGPMAGVHDDPAKKLQASFSLTCDDSIVMQVLTGQISDGAVLDAVKKKLLAFEGDLDLFIAFTERTP